MSVSQQVISVSENAKLLSRMKSQPESLNPKDIKNAAKVFANLAAQGKWPAQKEVVHKLRETCESFKGKSESAAIVLACRLLKQAKVQKYLTVQFVAPKSEVIAEKLKAAFGDHLEVHLVPEGLTIRPHVSGEEKSLQNIWRMQ